MARGRARAAELEQAPLRRSAFAAPLPPARGIPPPPRRAAPPPAEEGLPDPPAPRVLFPNRFPVTAGLRFRFTGPV